MKSYTDIEQSKKLAEFLSPKSADMGWYYSHSPNATRNQMWVGTKAENADIPCWSLAALLDVLPLGIDTHKQTDGCKMYYYVELYTKRMRKEIYLSTERYENLVDACVAMIEKLHKSNLL